MATNIERNYICKMVEKTNDDGTKENELVPVSPITHTGTNWDEQEKKYLDVIIQELKNSSGLPSTSRLDVDTEGEYVLDAYAGKKIYDLCDKVFQSANRSRDLLAGAIGVNPKDYTLSQIAELIRNKLNQCSTELNNNHINCPPNPTFDEVIDSIKNLSNSGLYWCKYRFSLTYNDIAQSKKRFGADGNYYVYLTKEAIDKKIADGTFQIIEGGEKNGAEVLNCDNLVFARIWTPNRLKIDNDVFERYYLDNWIDDRLYPTMHYNHHYKDADKTIYKRIGFSYCGHLLKQLPYGGNLEDIHNTQNGKDDYLLDGWQIPGNKYKLINGVPGITKNSFDFGKVHGGIWLRLSSGILKDYEKDICYPDTPSGFWGGSADLKEARETEYNYDFTVYALKSASDIIHKY